MPGLIPLSGGPVSAAQYGGKAAGLALLLQNGLPVPQALLVEACESPEELDESFLSALIPALAFFPRRQDGRFSVAVRSSCTAEDGYDASQAGLFQTVLDWMTPEQVLQAARQVVASLGRAAGDGRRMGVVIQAAVDADYSGVLFSSSPLTYSRHTVLISYTRGTGEHLVSGITAGWDVELENGALPHSHGPMDGSLLLALARDCKALEARLGYPVDVEWAVRDGALFYLQCRPLASITGIPTTLRRVTAGALDGLPPELVSHGKVQLRLAAQRAGVLISDAWVLVRSECANAAGDCPLPERSPRCSGYSAVLIQPRHVGGKVTRSFVGDPGRAAAWLARHPGREVSSAPKYPALEDCLADYAALTRGDYWISVTIIQEIFQPKYTGVIQRVADGWVAELTRGHFLTKGVVDTSQFLLEDGGAVTCRREARQKSWFEIVEGHVLSCRSPEGEAVRLPDSSLRALAQTFSPFLGDGCVVEFGVPEEGDGSPYLIDYVEEDPKAGVTAAQLSSGILSRGRAMGALRRLEEDAEDGLNVHLYDAAEDGPRCQDAVIFFCHRPNIALLPLLDRYHPGRIGFVFAEGSVLCHFAVALREKGIPAIRLDGPLPSWPEGALCRLDGESPHLTGRERVTLV